MTIKTSNKPLKFEERVKRINEAVDKYLYPTEGIRSFLSSGRHLVLYRGNLGHIVGEIFMDEIDHWYDADVRDSFRMRLSDNCFKLTNIPEIEEQRIENIIENTNVGEIANDGNSEGSRTESDRDQATGESGNKNGDTESAKPKSRKAGRPKR